MAAAEARTAPANVSIRPAVPDDAAALADLSRQLGYPVDAATLRERLGKIKAQRVGEIFVASHGDRVVGWTHVVPRMHLEEGAFAELAGLVVDESARNLGVGAALLAAAESWARDHEFERLRVRSNVIRERAHRFYLREKYAERKRQVVFEKNV
jgi:GNAT superfamily N-acetyltransferase